MSGANFAGCRMGILSRRAVRMHYQRSQQWVFKRAFKLPGRNAKIEALVVASRRGGDIRSWHKCEIASGAIHRLSCGKGFASTALSAPFTSETRAFRRNATSGYPVSWPRCTLKEPKQPITPSSRRSIREDNASSRLVSLIYMNKRRAYTELLSKGYFYSYFNEKFRQLSLLRII